MAVPCLLHPTPLTFAEETLENTFDFAHKPPIETVSRSADKDGVTRHAGMGAQFLAMAADCIAGAGKLRGHPDGLVFRARRAAARRGSARPCETPIIIRVTKRTF
jgi:hypothetical protein